MKPTLGRHSTAAVLLVAALAMAQGGDGQSTPITPKDGAPRIRPTFSREAVKALLTIEGTHDSSLVEAAMIDLSAAQSTRAELKVVWHIQLFQQIYALHAIADDHDGDHRCTVAWILKLRGFSAEIPRQCPRLTPDEMSAMNKP